MKRTIIFISAMFLLTLPLFSQVRYGIRGGLNVSNINAKDLINNNIRISYPPDIEAGFHFGAFSQIRFFNVFIQPELLLTTNKSRMEIEDLRSEARGSVLLTYNKLDIPVLGGIMIGPVKIEVGPVGSFLLNNTSELVEFTDYKHNYKNAVIGFQAGAGLEISDFTFELKYERNLSRLGESINIASEEFIHDNRMTQFIFTVGLFF